MYCLGKTEREEGGDVLLYINETIAPYEVQLQEEANCHEAMWCKLVTGHTTFTIGILYSCPNITNRTTKKCKTL